MSTLAMTADEDGVPPQVRLLQPTASVLCQHEQQQPPLAHHALP
jgi:hypothetical protein